METDSYVRENSLRLEGFDYSSRRIYFVTIVVKNRRNVFLNHGLSKAVLNSLFELRIEYRFNLYCYCLMPDHFHGLIGVGESEKTLSDIVGSFKSNSTKASGFGIQANCGTPDSTIISLEMNKILMSQ